MHFAYTFLHNSGDAEDAVQEVMLRLWKMRYKLDLYKSPEALAMQITRNLCLDRIKAKKPVYIDNYRNLTDQNSDDNNPHTLLEKSDRLAFLSGIINDLPEKQRTIIQLRDLQHIEFEEIAAILNMNINAIRVNLSRARNKIKDELIKFEKYEYQPDKNTAR